MTPNAGGKAAVFSRYGLCLLVAASALGLAACTSNPLGMSDQEWAALTPEQRLQVRQKQLEYAQALEQRQAAALAERQAQARQRAAELELRRQQARYGERVQCVLAPAQGWFNQQWRDIEPLALDLLTGSEQVVTVRQMQVHAPRYSARAYARFDGQQVSLCLRSESESSPNNRCVRFLGTFADYRHGIAQPVHSHQYVRGQMRCSLVP